MKITLIAIGTNMPDWVDTGYESYANRLRQEVKLELIEIESKNRNKNIPIAKILEEEADKIQHVIPKGAYVIGLDVLGNAISTEKMAENLKSWLQMGRNIAILIGGPEGFAPEINALCDTTISLSKLTFPHPLVRIILSEQIYRAWSILHNHPYHRA